MPTHHETRRLRYTARQMYDLVADVARYPEFLPWNSAARIRTVTERGVWGFTIGSAIFDGSYLPGADTRTAVAAVLADAASAGERV